MRGKDKFFDNDGEVIGRIKRHLSFYNSRSLIDWNGKKVGVIKQKPITFFSNTEYWIKDQEGKTILHVQGDFKHCQYAFFDDKKRNVAEVKITPSGECAVRLTKEGENQEIDPFLILSSIFAIETTTKTSGTGIYLLSLAVIGLLGVFFPAIRILILPYTILSPIVFWRHLTPLENNLTPDL